MKCYVMIHDTLRDLYMVVRSLKNECHTVLHINVCVTELKRALNCCHKYASANVHTDYYYKSVLRDHATIVDMIIYANTEAMVA